MESQSIPGAVEEQPTAEFSTQQQSILDRLRQSREEVRQSRFLDLDVAGYNGELVARYTTVPFKTFETDEKKRRKNKGQDPELLAAALDQIIACCVMIMVKDPGHPACVLDNDGNITDLRPIDPDAAAPVKWEQRLGELIGIPDSETMGQARLVVQRTFCNDAAVIFHASRLGLWLRDTTKELDESLLGE